jgi:hypothetical protein
VTLLFRIIISIWTLLLMLFCYAGYDTVIAKRGFQPHDMLLVIGFIGSAVMFILVWIT